MLWEEEKTKPSKQLAKFKVDIEKQHNEIPQIFLHLF